LSFVVAVIARRVTNSRDNRGITLLKGCSREWVVRDRSLGCPVTSGNGRQISRAGASDPFGDDLLHEDGIVKTERIWIKIEVSLCWWVVGCRVIGPDYINEIWCWNTVLRITVVRIVWRIRPDITSRWLRWVTDVTWRTTPESIFGRILRNDGCCLCWLGANESFGNCYCRAWNAGSYSGRNSAIRDNCCWWNSDGGQRSRN
jgi:hypothetical protein